MAKEQVEIDVTVGGEAGKVVCIFDAKDKSLSFSIIPYFDQPNSIKALQVIRELLLIRGVDFMCFAEKGTELGYDVRLPIPKQTLLVGGCDQLDTITKELCDKLSRTALFYIFSNLGVYGYLRVL